MISTVTPKIMADTARFATSGSLTLVLTFVLIVLLIQKEFALASKGRFARALSRVLTIGIVPLAIAFVLIFVTKVGEILR